MTGTVAMSQLDETNEKSIIEQIQDFRKYLIFEKEATEQYETLQNRA